MGTFTLSPFLLAAEMPIAEVSVSGKSAAIPDITQVSLDSFGKLPDSDQGAADVLAIADLSGLFDFREMTIGAAVAHWPKNRMETLTLEQYPFLSDMTLLEVADMAGLQEKEIGELPFVAALLSNLIKDPMLAAEKKLRLEQVLEKYPQMGSIQLSFLDLEKYSYTAIPNLLDTPIAAIPNWQQIKVSDIAGLREMPIHPEIAIDGEIVSLSAIRKDDRVEIQLTQDLDLSMTWSSEISKGLRPFGSFSITPTIQGEAIAVDAYFKSCASENRACQQVGPFAYPDYRKGDAFYVSADDWAITLAGRPLPAKVEQPVSTTAEALVPAPTPTPIYKMPSIRAIALVMLILISTGMPALFWLTSKWGRKQV
jgi:hypothetical protein